MGAYAYPTLSQRNRAAVHTCFKVIEDNWYELRPREEKMEFSRIFCNLNIANFVGEILNDVSVLGVGLTASSFPHARSELTISLGVFIIL